MINQENSKYDSLNQPVENKQQLAYQQIKQDGIRNSINYWSAILETNVWKQYMIS